MSGLHVAVIGGGYSGTLQTIHLLRRGAHVTLIERDDRLARGVAYSTPHADHLLNVRAGGMSAFAEAPDHFAEWLAARGAGGRDDFAERRLYGTYLEELLGAAANQAGNRLTTLKGEALDVARTADSEHVLLADGRSVRADAAILAVGNFEPDLPRGVEPGLRDTALYVPDPWASDFAQGLGDEESVLLIGTGLTAVDAALMLDSAGFRGRTLALSRRGLVPRAHADPAAAVPGLDAVPARDIAGLVRFVRAEAARLGWRPAVDQLRPLTQSLWAKADEAERRRFLRHLRPYWDVHRHRIAPSIADRIVGMISEGRLEIAAGKILSSEVEGAAATVRWRPRGSERVREERVSRVVNCTGPQMDIRRAGEPLLDALVASGRIRPDVCRIGIDVNDDLAALDAGGAPVRGLYAIGPMTRGAFWEIVAVPDIRRQVQALAERLAV